MKTKEIFAKRLVDLREKKEITQQTLADNLGITRQSLSLYEQAERTINIDLLVKISKFFDVSTDYLLGLTQTKTTDADFKSVCDYTGLSEKAVEKLCKIKQKNKINALSDTISDLIENENFELALVLASQYLKN